MGGSDTDRRPATYPFRSSSQYRLRHTYQCTDELRNPRCPPTPTIARTFNISCSIHANYSSSRPPRTGGRATVRAPMYSRPAYPMPDVRHHARYDRVVRNQRGSAEDFDFEKIGFVYTALSSFFDDALMRGDGGESGTDRKQIMYGLQSIVRCGIGQRDAPCLCFCRTLLRHRSTCRKKSQTTSASLIILVSESQNFHVEPEWRRASSRFSRSQPGCACQADQRHAYIWTSCLFCRA